MLVDSDNNVNTNMEYTNVNSGAAIPIITPTYTTNRNPVRFNYQVLKVSEFQRDFVSVYDELSHISLPKILKHFQRKYKLFCSLSSSAIDPSLFVKNVSFNIYYGGNEMRQLVFPAWMLMVDVLEQIRKTLEKHLSPRSVLCYFEKRLNSSCLPLLHDAYLISTSQFLAKYGFALEFLVKIELWLFAVPIKQAFYKPYAFSSSIYSTATSSSLFVLKNDIKPMILELRVRETCTFNELQAILAEQLVARSIKLCLDESICFFRAFSRSDVVRSSLTVLEFTDLAYLRNQRDPSTKMILLGFLNFNKETECKLDITDSKDLVIAMTRDFQMPIVWRQQFLFELFEQKFPKCNSGVRHPKSNDMIFTIQLNSTWTLAQCLAYLSESTELPIRSLQLAQREFSNIKDENGIPLTDLDATLFSMGWNPMLCEIILRISPSYISTFTIQSTYTPVIASAQAISLISVHSLVSKHFNQLDAISTQLLSSVDDWDSNNNYNNNNRMIAITPLLNHLLFLHQTMLYLDLLIHQHIYLVQRFPFLFYSNALVLDNVEALTLAWVDYTKLDGVEEELYSNPLAPRAVLALINYTNQTVSLNLQATYDASIFQEEEEGKQVAEEEEEVEQEQQVAEEEGEGEEEQEQEALEDDEPRQSIEDLYATESEVDDNDDNDNNSNASVISKRNRDSTNHQNSVQTPLKRPRQ